MNQKERRAIRLARHCAALEAVATLNGLSINGRKVSAKLLTIENEVSRVSTDYCNGGTTLEALDAACDSAESKITALFGGSIKGLHINRDPRGHALKIDDDAMRLIYSETGLMRGMGGYGLLAPQIDGRP